MTAARRQRLREAHLDSSVRGLIVTYLPNIHYLTGFSGSNAVLFVSLDDPDDDVLATDGRYVEQAGVQCPDLPLIVDRGSLDALARSLASHGIVDVGMESTATLVEHRTVLAQLRQVEVVDGWVETLRSLKDEEELAALAQAGGISVAAFEILMREAAPGWSERRMARRLEQIFGELGAQDRAFATIVASGPNAAVPHHEPSERPLTDGDLVIIDFGAKVAGYHADMTRTAVVGTAAGWQIDLHSAVAEAQAAGRAAARPGTDLAVLDDAARSVLEAAGLGPAFSHGLGHGIGLEIHEAPMIGARAIGSIPASTAITIEPGAYLPGRGGVRIEDSLVVRPDGPWVLTEVDRGLWPIGG